MLIVCATDRRYVEMTGVLVRSICAQNHLKAPEIVVFCADIGVREKEKLQHCRHGAAKLSVVDIPSEVYKDVRDLPVQRHLSVTAYVSIYLPHILKDRGGRLLYLDSDIVVNTPLDRLFDVDLLGCSVGAVQDTAPAERLREFNAALGHPSEAPYFNSGVFLVDIEAWNARDVTQRGANYARQRTGPVHQHDQAVLNFVLWNDWVPLESIWNEKPTRLAVADAQSMPIMHYRGRLKPFYSDYPADYRIIYDQYRAQTPWAKSIRPTPLWRSIEKRRRQLKDFWAHLLTPYCERNKPTPRSPD